jgi:NAD(P)-dependent dehydrogenase (short-subunit alcohol dehydrogenase family)
VTSIVVTGASSGIGRATALLLAESGHQVFATVRKKAQAFLPLLRRARGRIVMIGSIGVRCTPPFSGPIVIPKAALTALTHALRQEQSA